MVDLPNVPTKVPPPNPLALRRRDAARRLGIGQRKLWELSQPARPDSVRSPRNVLPISVKSLEAWLAEQATKAARS